MESVDKNSQVLLFFQILLLVTKIKNGISNNSVIEVKFASVPIFDAEEFTNCIGGLYMTSHIWRKKSG